MKKRGILFVTAVLMLFVMLMPVHAAISIPDSTNSYVNDYMNVLSQDTINEISEKNDQLEGGAEILILTTDYIGTDTEEFAYQVFNQWEIGDAGKNNGVLMVLVVNEQKYWVTTGTGLDDVLSAGTLSDILYDCFEEDFDAGNYDAAVLNTFNEIWEIVGNKYGVSISADYSENNGGMMGIGNILFLIAIIFIVIMVIAMIVALPRRTYRGGYYRPTARSYGPRRYENPHRSFGSGMPRGPVIRPQPVRRSTTPSRSFSSRSSSAGRSSFGSGMRSGGGGRTRGGGAGRK